MLNQTDVSGNQNKNKCNPSFFLRVENIFIAGLDSMFFNYCTLLARTASVPFTRGGAG
jgi:hypothetical protein